jgi:hypothetical protein
MLHSALAWFSKNGRQSAKSIRFKPDQKIFGFPVDAPHIKLVGLNGNDGQASPKKFCTLHVPRELSRERKPYMHSRKV